jgi:hypothetical protein
MQILSVLGRIRPAQNLDIIGDLALLGMPFLGKIKAQKAVMRFMPL